MSKSKLEPPYYPGSGEYSKVLNKLVTEGVVFLRLTTTDHKPFINQLQKRKSRNAAIAKAFRMKYTSDEFLLKIELELTIWGSLTIDRSDFKWLV